MKNIIITGAAGMIGSELIEKLVKKKNNNIIAIDNFLIGNKKNIQNFLKKPNFKFYNLDLSRKINKKIYLKGEIDEIWMLAANSDIKKGNADINVDHKNTFLTTFNTYNYFKNRINDKTKVIFSSSSAIYGEQNKEIKENNFNYKPQSAYGYYKLVSEKYLEFVHKIHSNFILRIYRFPNVVGKNLTHGILFDFNIKNKSSDKIFNVLGDGFQKKPYSYSSEIIDAMLFMNKKNNKKIIINLGYGDRGIRVRDIVELFDKFQVINKEIKYEKKKEGWKGDVVKYKYDVKNLIKHGFKFKFDSKLSIIKSIKHIK